MHTIKKLPSFLYHIRWLKTSVYYNILWLSLGSNQYWSVWVFDLCVYYIKGASEGSTKSSSGKAEN